MPAPEIEKLVLDGIRQHLAACQTAEHPPALDDRDLIDMQVDCVLVKPETRDATLRTIAEADLDR